MLLLGQAREERRERELIERSGLFDRTWYFAQNPGVARSGNDPVRDYLRRGAAAGCNPNGIFDGAWYLARNPDAAGTNPLVHYIQHGAAAGRDPGPLFDTQWYVDSLPLKGGGVGRGSALAHYLKHGWKRGLLPFDPAQRFADTRIAVVVHLFYAELWAEIASWLRNIPVGFDLFVTVPREHAAELRELVLRDYSQAQVHAVPNAGRDVGAFFAVLPKVLAGNYTALCKLHSKKGKDHPEAWRDLLLRGTLANRMLVSRILHALASDPDLALIGSREVYLCGETQILQNQSRIEEIVAQVCPGSRLPKNWGFFAGTMFWARPDFFAPFLECGAHLLDFETDNTARDGQLAHAFERVFGALAAVQKKRIAVTDIAGTGASDGTIHVTQAPGHPWRGPFGRILREHSLRLKGDVPFTCNIARSEPHENLGSVKKQLKKLPVPLQWALKLAYWTATLQLFPRLRLTVLRRRDAQLIRTSSLFEADWYLDRYPDVRAAGIDPAFHYAAHGASGWRDPGPHFDTAWYLMVYPDVSAAGANPLAHYLRSGAAHGRLPHPSHMLIGDSVEAALSCRKAAAADGEIALLVTHSPDGHLKPHVPHYLAALRKQGIHPVLIVAADAGFTGDAALLQLVDGLYVRQNVGFDFGAWAHVLRSNPDLLEADILYLVNDSMIGPLNEQKFAHMLARIRASTSDVIGLTDSYEKGWHLQSYFIALKQGALASPALRTFVDGIQNLADKRGVVNAYEVRMAQFLEAAGLSCEALFPVKRGYKHSTADLRALIRSGLPFVKMSALRQRSQEMRPRDWRKFLRSEGFDPRLTEQTLNAALGA